MKVYTVLVGLSCGLFSGVDIHGQMLIEQPEIVGSELVFPENGRIPRYLTDTENWYIARNPLWKMVRATDPPTGPVLCVAEYEPMEGVLIAWEGFTTILKQMAREITTTGNADLYVVVDSASEQNSATIALQSAGVDMNRVKFVIRRTDTVWIRDYGPRYIYEGGCRAIVDHTYNRPRPNDNAFNSYFGPYKGHEVYEIPLVHGGGNYHLNALNEGNATRLVVNENPSLTEQDIHDIWQDFQNVDTTFWTPFPVNIDSTQHIDMWMQIVADNKIIISDWPYNVGSTQDQICDQAAADFTSRGWSVYRVPARSVWGTHYTYTNMVLCNDLVLLPMYTNSQVTQHNSEALAVVQSALPEKTVVQINCEDIVQYAGVMHCIVMHVPVPEGGENPTAYLRSPDGGEIFTPGEQVNIQWITDDNIQVTEADLLLSTDGGLTFPVTVAEGISDTGNYTWTIPDLYSSQARIRIVAHDADNNTGYDDSDSDFTINGTPINCPGDLNDDLIVDQADLGILLQAYLNNQNGDLDGDGDTDQADLGILLSNYGSVCS